MSESFFTKAASETKRLFDARNKSALWSFLNRAAGFSAVALVFAAALALLAYSWSGVFDGWTSEQNNNPLPANVRGLDPHQILEATRSDAPEASRHLRPNASVYRNRADKNAGIEFAVFPVRGTITDSYGFRSNPFGFGLPEFHAGLDIGAAQGTPVVAAASGTVTFAGWNGGYGNVVMIDHDNSNVSTRYAHLMQFVVAPGQPVSGGSLIGYVGSTGRSTGPHLHFEVRVNNTTINPLTVYPRKQ